MAGAGKAFIKHTKGLSPPEQVHDNGYGLPPHPLDLREGMRFFPRKTEPRKPAWPLTVRGRTAAGAVRCHRDDPENPAEVVFAESWLLRTRRDGQGSNVQFAGWAPRKYRTVALVVAIDERIATLVLPEWHPSRPVPLDPRLLPRGSGAGVWLSLRADLSVGRAAKLAPSHLTLLPDGPRERLHPVDHAPPEPTVEPERPEVGEGCGDVVLTVEPDILQAAPRGGGLIELYVYRRPDATKAGDWVYLAPTGSREITARLQVRDVRSLPVGALLRCDPEPISVPARLLHPTGERHTTRWLWRWFARPIS